MIFSPYNEYDGWSFYGPYTSAADTGNRQASTGTDGTTKTYDPGLFDIYSVLGIPTGTATTAKVVTPAAITSPTSPTDEQPIPDSSQLWKWNFDWLTPVTKKDYSSGNYSVGKSDLTNYINSIVASDKSTGATTPSSSLFTWNKGTNAQGATEAVDIDYTPTFLKQNYPNFYR